MRNLKKKYEQWTEMNSCCFNAKLSILALFDCTIRYIECKGMSKTMLNLNKTTERMAMMLMRMTLTKLSVGFGCRKNLDEKAYAKVDYDDNDDGHANDDE